VRKIVVACKSKGKCCIQSWGLNSQIPEEETKYDHVHLTVPIFWPRVACCQNQQHTICRHVQEKWIHQDSKRYTEQHVSHIPVHPEPWASLTIPRKHSEPKRQFYTIREIEDSMDGMQQQKQLFPSIHVYNESVYASACKVRRDCKNSTSQTIAKTFKPINNPDLSESIYY
jgi:hypothetical protein